MDDSYQPPKAALSDPAIRKIGRTKAQIAFDRCMFVLAGIMVIPMVTTILPQLDARQIPATILYAALMAWWIRSLTGVIATWSEPDARVLRFSALAVLALGGVGIVGLLIRHNLFGLG